MFYLLFFMLLIFISIIFSIIHKTKSIKKEKYYYDSSASSSTYNIFNMPDYLYGSLFYSSDDICKRTFKTIFPQREPKINLNIMYNTHLVKTIPYYNYADENNRYNKPIINPMSRYQGVCGSCYAFATILIVESLLVSQDMLILGQSLSVQQIVDCTSAENCTVNKPSKGCGGGSIRLIATSIFNDYYNICFEDGYPYNVKQTKVEPKLLDKLLGYKQYVYKSDCPQKTQCPGNYYTLPPMELISINGNDLADFDYYLMSALFIYGPIGFLFYGSQNEKFHHYTTYILDTNKIYKEPNDKPSTITTDRIDHYLVLVGWGITEKDEKYWIVRNSWSNNWGHGGYIWFPRGETNYFNSGPKFCNFYSLSLVRPGCSVTSNIEIKENVLYSGNDGTVTIEIKSYLPGDTDPSVDYILSLTMTSKNIDGTIIPYVPTNPIYNYVDSNWNILDQQKKAINNSRNYYKENINTLAEKGEIPKNEHTGNWAKDRWFIFKMKLVVPSNTNGCLWEIIINIQNKKIESLKNSITLSINWNLKILVTEIKNLEDCIYVNVLEDITSDFYGEFDTTEESNIILGFPFNDVYKKNETQYEKYTRGLPLTPDQYIFKINNISNFFGFFSQSRGNPKISN